MAAFQKKIDEEDVIVFTNSINEMESYNWNESEFFSNRTRHVDEENESWGGKVTFLRTRGS